MSCSFAVSFAYARMLRTSNSHMLTVNALQLCIGMEAEQRLAKMDSQFVNVEVCLSIPEQTCSFSFTLLAGLVR
jgi:hypothetical protein